METGMTHRITLERQSLRFAAAHFATFGGDCEPLHGHNYAVTVELGGSLTAEESWVLDFSEAKRMARGICKELDHKFILQAESRVLGFERTGDSYTITFGDRRYVMPASDVAALPIDNSTAERLAEWFAGRIASELAARGAANVGSLTVGIEEAPGQTGWFTTQGLARPDAGKKG
jgi:6-pyruvoyltetrahydropterin/6-carboxytetrahydropterin synthase